MIHLTPIQQMELRRSLTRVKGYATHTPHTNEGGDSIGPIMSTQLDLFVDDVLEIIGPNIEEMIFEGRYIISGVTG